MARGHLELWDCGLNKFGKGLKDNATNQASEPRSSEEEEF